MDPSLHGNYEFDANDFDDDDDVVGDKQTRKAVPVSTPRGKRPATATTSSTETAVQVYLRIRPLSVGRSDDAKNVQPCVRNESDTNVCTYNPVSGDMVATYNFSQVFGSQSSQEEIFSATTEPLINNIFLGRHALIFAYGITCSGKTFTMQGTDSNKGILPRALDAIFERIRKSNMRISVDCSYLEIYNESVNDLLDPRNKNLTINCADNYMVTVKDLSEERLQSSEEAFQVIARGIKNRQVGATALNKDSSRSHSVFNIMLKVDGELFGKLSVVDLAGAERSNRTGNTGKAQTETNAINLSLSALNNCLEACRKNTRVPYRDSNLTKLFKDVFSGTGSLAMICNVNPTPSEFDETVQSLQYAAMAKSIKIRAKIDMKRGGGNAVKRKDLVSTMAVEQLEKQMNGKEMEIECLQEEIYRLKQELVSVAERVAKEKESMYRKLSSEKDAAYKIMTAALEEKCKSIGRQKDDEMGQLKLLHTQEQASKLEIDTDSITQRLEDALHDQYEATIVQLEQDYEDAKFNLETREGEVLHLQDEQSEKQERVEHLESQLKSVEEELQQRSREVSEWESEYDAVTKQALEGVSMLRDKFHQRCEVVEQVARAAGVEHEKALASVKSELKECMLNNQKLSTLVDDVSARNAALEAELAQLRAQMASGNAAKQNVLADAFIVRQSAAVSMPPKRKSDEGLADKRKKIRASIVQPEPANDENEDNLRRSTRVTRARTATAAVTKDETPRTTRSVAAKRKALVTK